MNLSSGTRLGPYEIVAPLGAGGMGEVWRARDTRLHREVAIKVLPDEVALDPERLARFEREAHLLAALNHPHIGAIYGLEESGATKALILELVEGSTLADRLAQGPMALEEALSIAGQIAEALEAAHERGIVHRDLKPANVKVTPAGEVKVLDFGLAKARDPQSSADLAHSPTITAMATRQGVILGTAAYMSPEQARGGAVDKRSDLWAFGVLVWELVTGRRLFDGESVSDTLAAVLRADLDWSDLPAESPPALRRLLRRCIERDPRHRLRDAGDAREEIEEAARELRQGAAVPSAPPSRRALPLWAAAALALGGLGVGWLAARAWRPGSAASTARPSPVLRAEVPLAKDVRLYGWATPVISLSPDGRTLAYVGWKAGSGPELYVHRLDTGETRVVPNSQTAEGPFFSPDGAWVAFAVGASLPSAGVGGGPELRKYSLETGLTQTLCPVADYFGGAWRADGTIFFVGREPDGLMRVPAGGGKAEPAVATVLVGGTDQPRSIAWPQLLPGGERVLVTDWSAAGDYASALLDLKTRELRPIDLAALFCRYAPTGHLVCLREDGSLVAVGFDAEQGALRGAPVALMNDVSVSGNLGAVLAFSDGGTLAYSTGYVRNSMKELFRIVRVRPDGPSEPLAIAPAEFLRTVRLSPDRNRLAVATWDGSLWVYDLRRGSRVRVARHRSATAEYPAWSPDGRSLAYTLETGNGFRIARASADGSQAPEALLDLPDDEIWVAGYLADGRLLFSANSDGPAEIWALAADPKEPPTKLVAAPARAANLYAAPSPDGRWLAYASNETGRQEIYVRSLASGATVPASVGGGTLPRWSPDSRELYYVNEERIFAVPLIAGDPLHFGLAEELATVSELRGYDVAGPREFIALQRLPDSGIQTRVHLIVNWFEELRRLAPAPGPR